MTGPSATGAHTVTIPPAGRYVLDTARSTVTFRTRHMFGLAPVRGSFALDGGEVEVADPVGGSTARADISARSFTTGNPMRDRVVRSAQYLYAANHPVLRFSSGELVHGDGTWALDGELTVRGTASRVRLEIEHCEHDGSALAARATTRIDRTEFAITGQRGMTGRYLDLVLEIVAAPSSAG